MVLTLLGTCIYSYTVHLVYIYVKAVCKFFDMKKFA